MSILVEACTGGVEETLNAEIAGANRIELCDNLDVGGLTPPLEVVREIKQKSKIPIMAMLRPREGDFCYSDEEFQTMVDQATDLISEGVEGLVFGILHKDNTIDSDRCMQLIRHISHESFKLPKRVQIVFHKAFDETPDWKTALQDLINMGFDRVLTSGHGKTVLEGADELSQIIKIAEDKIEILAGGGVRKENVLEVIKNTKASQVHLKCFCLKEVVDLCSNY